MKSLWSDWEAESRVSVLVENGISRELALRIYSSRLLGGDPRLVLHGGGNVSLKTMTTDLFGEDLAVLHIKGSGWDMAHIEAAGLPAVRLAPLLALRRLESLSDEAMVNFQRGALLDSTAPTPSVETLLHAFLPHKFVDHTHAIAVLSLSDQPNGAALCRELYGERVGIVPYVMPGFALAKAAAEVFARNPEVEGLILEKHGIFSFGDTAKQAYERMIDLVTLAEERLQVNRKPSFAKRSDLPLRLAAVEGFAPILRGQLASPLQSGAWKRCVLDFRTSEAIRTYVDGQDVGRYSQIGVVTPDHTIRTKNWPLVLPPVEVGEVEAWLPRVKASLLAYVEHYHTYFARNNERVQHAKTELDPFPTVILAPGYGLFGVGSSKKAAMAVADIAVNTIACITDAEAIGTFQPVSEADMFDCEYWSLEQAKLGSGMEKPLARQVAVVTGGGGGIGRATALAFAREGCEVAVLDINAEAAAATAKAIGGTALGLACDVTDPKSVLAAFQQVCLAFGGMDIVVSNAGAAWQGSIGEVDPEQLRQSFELNFFAHQTVAQNAVRILRAQGTGGCLLFNTSKQALNPGKAFGPYGLPKAAALFLMKQYALDYGREGIRSNAINADRIRTGLLTNEMITLRARARGVSRDDYMAGNLLGQEVLPEDVADGFVFLAKASKTTACTLTVDGGNIEGSPR